MVEEIREVKITVYVNTNKATYEETFEDMDDAVEFFEDTIDELD